MISDEAFMALKKQFKGNHMVFTSAQMHSGGAYEAHVMLQVVAETDEPFVPVPDELIVNLKESREAVEALLDNLANTFAATTSVRQCAHTPSSGRCLTHIVHCWVLSNYHRSRIIAFLSLVWLPCEA